MLKEENPISRITWVDAQELKANDYNPNVVITPEMKLLEFSIRRNGWIQPVLITTDKVIIDGFHRATLARLNGWEVPCVVMDIDEKERMLLTIRINRAKGSHVAFKMADVMKKLVQVHGATMEEIRQGIGADQSEIDLLLQDGVFKALDTANHKYSKAWYPKR